MTKQFVYVKYYTNGGISNFPVKISKRLYDWDVALTTEAPFAFELATAAPDVELRDQEGRKRREVWFYDETAGRTVKVLCPSESAKIWDGTKTSVTNMPYGGPLASATVTAPVYARQGERQRVARDFGAT